MAFLIPISVLAFAINSALTRAVQIKFPGKKGILRIYQALFSLTAAIAFGTSFFVGTKGFSLSASEFVFGILFGVFYFVAVVGSSLGYELGSMSLTSIITNMSLFIPLIYSCLFLKEELKPLHIIGIVLIILTMVLSVNKGKKGEKNTASVKWLIIVLMAFFANGITAVLQKNYVLTRGEDGTMLFMAIAYITASLLFFGNALLIKGKSGEKIFEKPLLLSGMSCVSGLGSFGGNALLGILCVKIVGAVLYPCINGGLCIVSALISFTVFKEKLSVQKLIAIGVGVLAIVLLSL